MPKNSFPTFPNNPTPAQLVDKFFKKENNHSFVEELKFTFDNVFLSSGSFSMQRVYNTQTAFGDAGGAHFRGGESYPNPYYVGPPDEEFYTRECHITYWKDEVPSRFIGRYNDWGPDGIFFWFEGTADGIKKWYSDFDTLEWGPLENEQNSLGGGTVSLSEPATYRSVGPSIYNLTFAANTFGLGAGAPIEPPHLLPISPSDPIALAEGNGIILTHKGHYMTADNVQFMIYIGYGVPNTSFVEDQVNDNIKDHPPQWFILEVDELLPDARFYTFAEGSIFGNGDPDLFKFSGLPFTEEGGGAAGWNLSLTA